MINGDRSTGKRGHGDWLAHLAFWFGPVFALPLFIALHNIGEIGLRPWSVAQIGALACAGISVVSWLTTRPLPNRVGQNVAAGMVSLALLMALESNGLHDLYEFAVFDGRPINFRENSEAFWGNLLLWLALGLVTYMMCSRLEKIPAWLPILPIASFSLLVIPALLQPPQSGLDVTQDTAVDPSVFRFSRQANLVHLLPDGFQGDTVRQVLQDNPQLAKRFDGFTLYTDHLGRYPGTAPSLYSMLTGRPFPLARGFGFDWVREETRRDSYQAELAQHGYQVDLVPISNYICPKSANSCLPRRFKNDGFTVDRRKGLENSVRLLADLTLFRLAPLYLKEKIYDQGYWLLSDIADEDNSPIPDPILRDWIANMQIDDGSPVYKWYHYIGTHVPPRWDAGCDLRRGLQPVRENYIAQTHCVLNGIADFIDRLKQEGIFEQTAFIISGDHGHNTAPADQVGVALNFSMYEPMLGTARPALLVKPSGANAPLAYSKRPSHLLNIAPTALALAGLRHEGASVFDSIQAEHHPRVFQHYPIGPFWTGDPVPYVEYEVTPPAHAADHWQLTDIVTYERVPAEYDPVNRVTAKNFVYGAHLRRSAGNRDDSWIRGRQLAFTLDIPDNVEFGSLEIELRFEPWMEDQSASVQLNGFTLLQHQELPEGRNFETWQTLYIPMSKVEARDGPDFVSILFRGVYTNPKDRGEAAAGRIRTIRFNRR